MEFLRRETAEAISNLCQINPWFFRRKYKDAITELADKYYQLVSYYENLKLNEENIVFNNTELSDQLCESKKKVKELENKLTRSNTDRVIALEMVEDYKFAEQDNKDLRKILTNILSTLKTHIEDIEDTL